MNTPIFQPDITAAAVLFSRQFATLISAGVNLINALSILQEEAPPPYAEAMQTIIDRVQHGEMLSQVMVDLPQLFPPFYTVMVKAGEYGGALEIALTYTADLLQEDWTLSQLAGVPPLLMAGGDARTDWEQFSPVQRTLQLLLFCQAWGAMLASGVPVLLAMDVAAESLPPSQREKMAAARQVIMHQGTREEIVAPLTFLPQSVQALMLNGMGAGELDVMLLKAAELLRHQLAYQRQGA